MGPAITFGDLAAFHALRDTFGPLPMERSASELLSTRGTPPRDPDADPFLPSDDSDDPWETTL